MSLINNALKKAQRQRSEGSSSAPTPGGSSHRPSRRGKAMPAQTLLLIVAGACVVVALSVAVTVFFLRTPNPPEAVSTVADSTPVAPQLTTAPLVTASEAPPQPQPEPVIAAQVEVEPEPIAEEIPQALPEPPPPPPEAVAPPDVNVYAYIDQLKVMGVRFSGASSKVLMNDRVYRVNDLVDRTLGLRLTAVTPNTLTFVDANGASYIKYF